MHNHIHIQLHLQLYISSSTVRVAPSQGAGSLHEVPGQEYSCSHNGNTCGTESDCGGQICDGEVLVFVVQLLVRVFLELQHLHIEAKANL